MPTIKYVTKSSNRDEIFLSLIKNFLQYNHPNKIPKIYANEYHLTSKANKLKATGSKLLVNIFKK